MGKTVTIYFKNNKVSKVTGAKSKKEKEDAAKWAQNFADSAMGKLVEDVGLVVSSSAPTASTAPPAEPAPPSPPKR